MSLFTLTTTNYSATDLGLLIHKHPDHLHTLSLPFGKGHLFYPEVTEAGCTVAFLLNVDPIDLVRKKKQSPDHFSLTSYINDRPYALSSLMSVALNRAFRSLLSDQNEENREEKGREIALEARLFALPCRGDESILYQLFEPLGYEIEVESHLLDEKFFYQERSAYYTLCLKKTCQLRELLTHLYLLIPVLDDGKHYYIDEAEIEKLLSFGRGWLEEHPAKEMIAQRYLRFRTMSQRALATLVPEDQFLVQREFEGDLSLNEQRMKEVTKKLKEYNCRRIVDLGCGEGALLEELLKDPSFEKITGCDISVRALERAHRKLRTDRLPPMQKERLSLLQTSLNYRDQRLRDYDAAALIEVIEHLNPSQLSTFRSILFKYMCPRIIVITTPNAEYNVLFEKLARGAFRHEDHRFEWSRGEFEQWSGETGEEVGYRVAFEGIGPSDLQHGCPTQMALFVREE